MKKNKIPLIKLISNEEINLMNINNKYGKITYSELIGREIHNHNYTPRKITNIKNIKSLSNKHYNIIIDMKTNQ